jgi:hypothetical protein
MGRKRKAVEPDQPTWYDDFIERLKTGNADPDLVRLGDAEPFPPFACRRCGCVVALQFWLTHKGVCPGVEQPRS